MTNTRESRPPAPEIVLVAAVAENGVIGSDGDMPWRLSSDLRRFKRLTMGHPVVMGRKTFASIGRPLPGRTNIVITRDPDFSQDGIHAAPSLEDGLEVARRTANDTGASSVMVIGGGQIYLATIDIADRLEITRVHATPDGDTRFPAIDLSTWQETERQRPERGERDSADVTFLTYRRKRGD